MNRLSGDDTPVSTDPEPVMRVQDLHKSFGTLKVLRGVTIGFPRGRTTVVMGPSGCGKSVLLKHLWTACARRIWASFAGRSDSSSR